MKTRFIGLLVTLLVFGAVLALVLTGVSQASDGRDAEALRVTEDSLRRAVMSCYAIEGRYPESIEYLTENYGMYLDTDAYFVRYSVFASNIMPDITVIEK